MVIWETYNWDINNQTVVIKYKTIYFWPYKDKIPLETIKSKK